MSTITQVVNEKSTVVFTVAFTDEDGASVTPDSATFTLSDIKGNVVNAREGVTMSRLAASVDIVLSGEDLVISETLYNNDRVLTVEATYSSSLGSGLPLKTQSLFTITDLTKVT